MLYAAGAVRHIGVLVQLRFLESYFGKIRRGIVLGAPKGSKYGAVISNEVRDFSLIETLEVAGSLCSYDLLCPLLTGQMR
jgi:hypothetical protein